MNKKIILSLVGGVVLVGLLFVFSGISNDKVDENIEEKITSNNGKKLDRNSGVLCVQKVDVGGKGNSVTTKIYFAKNLMRYDTFLNTPYKGEKDLHMLMIDGYSYLWGNGMIANTLTGGSGVTGMKMKNDEKDKYGFSQNVDFEELEKSDFKAPGVECRSWKPDAKIFEIPSDIKFLEPDQMMQNMMNGAQFVEKGEEKNNQGFDLCGMCSTIPDENAKKECLKSCKQ